MSQLGYLFTGFDLAWIAVFFYVASLQRRSSELRRRIEVLEQTRSDPAGNKKRLDDLGPTSPF